MAAHKVTSANVEAALAQMDAVRETGASRLDQYVVKEPESAFEKVSEEEYKKRVEKRREEFVVGKNKMGYDDNGKELWEDENAKSELKRQEAELKQEREAAKSKAESPAKPVGAPLLAAFNNGSRAAATTEAPPSVNHDQQTKKSLDDMLKNMCGEIEASNLPADTQAQNSAPAKANSKRKSASGAEASQGSKKQAKGKAKAEKAGSADPVKVKKEPTDASATSVKTEPNVAAVKKELETTPQKQIKIEGGTVCKEASTAKDEKQVKEWLESSVAVKMESGSPAKDAMRLQPKLAEDGGLWFFFVDAVEDTRSSPPRVFLFGKVLVSDQFQSCCLVVENLERCFHLLLNVEDLDDSDAVNEVAQQADKELQQLCPGMKRLRTALKWRNYAFEKALPQGGGYLPFLKVICDPAGQTLQGNVTGQTFSTVFGQDQSLLERFLLTKRIMGPSWVRLHPNTFQESQARLSFCPVELRITPASITVAKNDETRTLLSEGCPSSSPPLRLLTLSMQTIQRSAQHGHEPVAVACTMHPNFSPDASDSDSQLKAGMQTWRAVRRFESRALPRDAESLLPKQQVDTFPSEQALFAALLQRIQQFDPDVIACQNAYGFDLDVLASRMSFHKLQFWQKLGRLRRAKDRMPKVDGRSGGFWVGTNITSGRLVCDLGLQAKDLLPKLSSYDLPTLARHQIGTDSLEEIEPENLLRYYDSVPTLADLARKTLENAMSIGQLVHSLQILPLTKQLTNLAGNMWNASLQNKRAERNEMLLCHEFQKAKFVLPDREKPSSKKRNVQATFDEAEEVAEQPSGSGPRRQKAAYSGGLVLEPKVGLYDDYVMLLDFNSLYPSIIQEHNICFTTVDRPDEEQVLQCAGEMELLNQTKLPDGTVEDGILPKVLRRLVSSRQHVKTQMKNERNAKTLQTLEIRQKALKLTANSMYGCLGFQHSRFYAKPLAALITAKGREALQSTIAVVEQELSLEVVYGDTDSVFVNTKTSDYNDAMQAGQQIKRSVNKRYKKLEIEVDGVFGRLLLLKKKKYAALKVVDLATQKFEREYKGLDIVRRDWCGLAKAMGQSILDQVLTGNGKEEAVNWIHQFLTDKCVEIDARKSPLDGFVITKGLTKLPQDYPDAKSLPHVQVALRLQARGKAIRANQEIEYVICEGEGKESFATRARHPTELALDPTLRLDIDWYKQHQIHPLISRLLGPVEGTDASRVADCLGMDGARFAQSSAKAGAAAIDDAMDSYMTGIGADVDALLDRRKRFKAFTTCLPGLKCKACEKDVSWKQMLQPEVSEATGTDALFRCGHCACELQPIQAQNALVMQIRSFLRRYSEGWVQSPEDALGSTRRAKTGRNLTSEHQVLKELEFLEDLCSGAAKGYAGTDNRGCRKAAVGMQKHANWLLGVNSYNWVETGKLFAGIFGSA